MTTIPVTDIPVPLYHYTSQRGLLSIISNKCIWATNIQYLNDATEFAYAKDLVIKEVQSLLESEVTDDIKVFLVYFMKLVSSSSRGVSICTCSFSTKGDQLSQWNGYCPDGNGFSIGFDFNSPDLRTLLEEQHFVLLPCIYKPDEQLETIRAFIQRYRENYQNQPQESNQSARISATLTDLPTEFLKLAPQLKHPAFTQENEWRLISGPILPNDERLRFRQGKSMLIPYIDVKLARDHEPMYISEVIVGPTPHRSLSRESLRGYLTSSNVSGPFLSAQSGKGVPNIRRSRIPYRAW